MSEHPFGVFVEGVVYRGAHYLMIRRAWTAAYLPGKIAFPSGKLEREALESALEHNVRREILEETGVQVLPPQYLESEVFEVEGRWCLSVKFLCEHADGDPRAQPEEVAEVMWMTYPEVEAHPDAPEWIKTTLWRAEQVLGRRR